MPTGAVAAPVGCYLIGYVRREHLGRVPMAVVPLFVAAMLLVPAAPGDDVSLAGAMAIASLILVLSEHARPQVRSAGACGTPMTQLGFIAILVGLVVLWRPGFRPVRRPGAVCDGVRAAVFMLTLVGFGSEGGPGATARLAAAGPLEAPSPVSALMSAAMVNLHLRHRPFRSAAAGRAHAGGACAAGRATRPLYGVLGFGGRRSQTAAGLFDDRASWA